jgi:DNA-binding CsgD family transcriptional regulator
LCNSLPSSIALSRLLGAAGASSALDAFEVSQTAAVLIDRHGHVLRPNAAAEKLLGRDIGIRHRKIASADISASLALSRALSELILGRDQAGLANPVKFSRVGRRPLIAYPCRLPAMAANPLSDCQAVVVLIDTEEYKLLEPDILRRIFGLTNAEARLAAVLVLGSSLDEVCDSLQISKETGRNHLKSIFAKTNTTRQSELMLALTLILPRRKSSDSN